jgi:hypothetical protein
MLHSQLTLSVPRELCADETVLVSGGFEEPLSPTGSGYEERLRDWYGFGYDDPLSDKLQEWGQQICNWLGSICPWAEDDEGPVIIVNAPYGIDLGSGFHVIMHQDGSGLISLMNGNTFLANLVPATPDEAHYVVTVRGADISAGVSTPRGGVEGSYSGGNQIVFHFRVAN